MPIEDLELDDTGRVIVRPLLLGYASGSIAAETTVILRLNYAEIPAEVRTGGRWLQVVMTPQQARDLAETLTAQATRLLEQKPKGPTN